jgi:hypothetical protein
LSRFERERAHLAVLEIRSEGEIAHTAHPIRLCSLTLEISGVLDLEIRSDEGFAIDIGAGIYSLQQCFKRDLLTSSDIDDPRGLRKAGTASSRKNRRRLIWAYTDSLCQLCGSVFLLQSCLNGVAFDGGVQTQRETMSAEASKRVILPHRQPEL